MQNIKLVINEYGPIRNAELDFAPMMVFTGNSNLGKSYVNYLWYYFISSFTQLYCLSLCLPKMVADEDVEEISFKKDDLRLWINRHAESFLQKLLNDNSLVCNVNFIFDIEDEINIRVEKVIAQRGNNAEDYVLYRVSINETEAMVFPDFFGLKDALYTLWVDICNKSYLIAPIRLLYCLRQEARWWARTSQSKTRCHVLPDCMPTFFRIMTLLCGACGEGGSDRAVL